MDSIQQFGRREAVKAGTCAAVHTIVDTMYYGNAASGKRAGLSFASQAAADMTEQTVKSVVLKSVQSRAVADMINPVISAGFYVLGTKAISGVDDKSSSYKFLHQLGSSLVANNTQGGVNALLGM